MILKEFTLKELQDLSNSCSEQLNMHLVASNNLKRQIKAINQKIYELEKKEQQHEKQNDRS